MTQVVLIRPGRCTYDLQGRIQGTLDIPLCEEGKAEVALLVQELSDQGIDTVYAAPCEPAGETAARLAVGLGAKVRKMDDLENLDHGLWQGMLVDEVRRRQPTVYRQWQEHPENVHPPAGESLDCARERMVQALERLLKRHRTGVLALVAPEPMATLISAHLGRRDVGDLWKAIRERSRWEVFSVAPEAARSGS